MPMWAGDDGLGHRGHTNQGCAKSAEGSDFQPGFKAGTADGGDRRPSWDFKNLQRRAACWARVREGFGVGFGHIEKSAGRNRGGNRSGVRSRRRRGLKPMRLMWSARATKLAYAVVFGDASSGVGENDCRECQARPVLAWGKVTCCGE